MALKDILTNGKYGDDITLSLPDGTTATVGEMRALEADERAALISRHNLLQQAEMELAQRFQSAVNQGWMDKDGNVVAQPRSSDAQIRSAAATKFGLDESDPLLGEIVKEVKALRSENEASVKALRDEMTKNISTFAGVVKSATGAYLNDFYGNKFEAERKHIPSKVRDKIKLEDVTKYADEHKLMDAQGRYDISSAIDRLTWEARKEEELEKVRAEARETAQKDEAMARINRPRGIGPQRDKSDFEPTVKDEKGFTRTRTLDEAIAAASQDDKLFEDAAKLIGVQ